MKVKDFLVTSLSALFVFSHSTVSEASTYTSKLSLNHINRIAKEDAPNERLKLLLQNMSSTISTSDATSVIHLHAQKKLSTYEFRGLFWTTQISKELMNILLIDLAKDQQLTSLDKVLIQSIAKKNISFDELLNEVKKEASMGIPSSMQSVLIDELVKLYLQDFDEINTDRINLYEKLISSSEDSTRIFLSQIKQILELEFFKRRLSQKQLVTPPNNSPFIYREIKTGFNLNYSFNIGRGGHISNHIKDFTKLTTGFGRSYNTETPSVVNLDITSDVTNDGFATNIDLLLNSFVLGGYDKGKRENATSILNYNLNGQIIIPKCTNPNFCDQIVTITVSDFGKRYGNSDQTNSGVAIKINGNNFANEMFNKLSVDISKNDAIIDITLTGSKKHIGACCFNKATFQKVNLKIEAGGTFLLAPQMAPKDFYSLLSFADTSAFFDLPFSDPIYKDLNSPSLEVIMLRTNIENLIKHKSSLDRYRNLFYITLESIQFAINSLVSTESDPMNLLYHRQKQSAISDLIGRNIILPIINSKMQAYQTASLLDIQQNINDMLKSILAINLKSENAQEEIRNKLISKVNNLDTDTKELVIDLLKFLKENKKDQNELLNRIASFQSEVTFMAKKMNSEMELLNIEKAQFTDSQNFNRSKVQ